jgi:nucleoside-diphosphate-sugar epimerase
MHMASPFPQDRPDDETELIVPAVEGTRRVLRAAYDAGVRRVVMTSSFAAMEYAPKTSGAHYVETDWTDPEGRAPYVKSKRRWPSAPHGSSSRPIPTGRN